MFNDITFVVCLPYPHLNLNSYIKPRLSLSKIFCPKRMLLSLNNISKLCPQSHYINFWNTNQQYSIMHSFRYTKLFNMNFKLQYVLKNLLLYYKRSIYASKYLDIKDMIFNISCKNSLFHVLFRSALKHFWTKIVPICQYTSCVKYIVINLMKEIREANIFHNVQTFKLI